MLCKSNQLKDNREYLRLMLLIKDHNEQ